MMLRKKMAAVIGLAGLILLMLSTVVSASFSWQSREGTINWAKGLADGTHVYLDAVRISKIRAQQTPAYIVVSECFSSDCKLAALTQASPLLRVGQTVDIEGDLITLESGDRALENVTVRGYCDSDGTLLYCGPLIKGLLRPIPWQWKTNLTVDTSTTTSSASQSESVSESMTTNEVTTETENSPTFYSTITAAKNAGVGALVELRCHPVSTGGTGSFVLGEDGSTDALTVYYTGTVSQTARIATVTGTIDTTNGTDRVLDVNDGPNFNIQESYSGTLVAATAGTISWAKTWADGHTFTTGELTGKVITRDWDSYFYIEEENRSSGIRVNLTSNTHHKGEKVDILGSLITNSDGERCIAASTVTQNGTGTITTLGMTNKNLGGGAYAGTGQLGVVNGYGLNNIGLLVRTCGKVTEIDTTNSPAQWFKIDDGSGVSVRVAYPPYIYTANGSEFVILSGISSCEYDTNNNLQRVLRLQPVTCTINQATGQADPIMTAATINFTTTFNEPVTGFTADDVTISGSAGGTKTVTVTQTDTEGKIYNIAVSDFTYGTVTAEVSAGVAMDSSGVLNGPSISTDNTVTYHSNIVYVKTPADGGSDSNSGWSWDQAKATVAAGITTAVSYNQTDTQVWVAKGTYNERISMQAGVSMYGGFVGSESAISERPAFPRADTDSYATILDGQNTGTVVTASATNNHTQINGFTIKRGTYGIDASKALSIYNCTVYSTTTCGIRVTSTSVALGYNVIRDNSSSGVYLSSSGGNIYNNYIKSNGGAGLTTNNSNGIIDSNRIEYNNGGGLSISNTVSMTITNNFIRGNYATSGGAIYGYFARMFVFNNTIVGNSCSYKGAGIYVRNNANQNAYIYNNIIASNTGSAALYLDNVSINYQYAVNNGRNCLYNNASNFAVTGSNASFYTSPSNISNSPGLATDGYHLATGSACINAGTASATDKDGNSWVVYANTDIDGNSRDASSVDIGCDEYVP